MSLFPKIFILFAFTFCSNAPKTDNKLKEVKPPKKVVVGAERMDQYLPLLKNKKVGLIVNQTSVISNIHLVDTLIKLGINIQLIFSPEHGFRGNQGAGSIIKDEILLNKNITIRSLYGKNKKPKSEDLAKIDVLIFDIQDVGVRFYTYISTMFLAMESCAENKREIIILDRPNPNGFLIDGPILNIKTHRSFVGMLPLPISHGLTIGELAKMINGQKWLRTKKKCKTTVISCQNWDHEDLYSLPIKPSPNLGSDASIYLYPSLCLFEGTPVSVGRGTYRPFEVFGAPWMDMGYYNFTPKPIKNMSLYPKYSGKKCRGMDLKSFATEILPMQKTLQLDWLILAYKNYKKTEQTAPFFTPFFRKLAGNNELQKQVEAGKTSSEIRKSWKIDLDKYKNMRKEYLLYP